MVIKYQTSKLDQCLFFQDHAMDLQDYGKRQKMVKNKTNQDYSKDIQKTSQLLTSLMIQDLLLHHHMTNQLDYGTSLEKKNTR